MPRRLGTRGGKDGDWEDIRGSKGMTQKKEVVVITEGGGGEATWSQLCPGMHI